MDSSLTQLIDSNAHIRKLDLRESENRRRIIAGYANVSDLEDSQGDIISHEALVNAWRRWKSNPDFCVLSLLHSNIPLAKVIFEDVVDGKGNLHRSGVDDKGLYIVAEVRSDVTIADEAWKKIQSGEYRGFSIGGRNLDPQPMKCEGDKCARPITDLELYEVAIVDHPANRVSLFNMLKRDDLAKLADATKNLREQIIIEGAIKVSKKPCPKSGHYHVLVKEGIPAPELCGECFAIVKEPVEGEEYVTLFDIALLKPESALTGEMRHGDVNPSSLKVNTPDTSALQEGKILSEEEKQEVKPEKEESKDDSGTSETLNEDAEKEEEVAVAPITLETLAADLALIAERMGALEKQRVEKVEKSAEPEQPLAEAEPEPTPEPEPAKPAEKVEEKPVIHARAPTPQPEPAPEAEPTVAVVLPVEPPKEPPKQVQPSAEIETRGVAPPQNVSAPRLDLPGVYKVPWREIHEAQRASGNKR